MFFLRRAAVCKEEPTSVRFCSLERRRFGLLPYFGWIGLCVKISLARVPFSLPPFGRTWVLRSAWVVVCLGLGLFRLDLLDRPCWATSLIWASFCARRRIPRCCKTIGGSFLRELSLPIVSIAEVIAFLRTEHGAIWGSLSRGDLWFLRSLTAFFRKSFSDLLG